MTDSNEVWRVYAAIDVELVGALDTALEMLLADSGGFGPTLSTFEIEGSDKWLMEIFFPGPVDDAFLGQLFDRAGCADLQTKREKLVEKDWVSESQKMREAVQAGRFFVYGSHLSADIQAGMENIQIDAGQAFGTGSHETTSACLELLDGLADRLQPKAILDLGTGTGVLAIAAQRLWPASSILATDIDPIAVDVTEANMTVNGAKIATGNGAGMAAIVADGLDHTTLQGQAPYDLVIANILAGPLVAFAPKIKPVMATGAKLILSGLLVTQEQEVLAAYREQGLDLVQKINKGDWSALLLG